MSIAPASDPSPSARAAAPARPDLRLVPRPDRRGEVRGFALYVGVDEQKAAAAGVDLPALVEALRRLAVDLVPAAETYAAVALAPAGAGGRDVDVVRRALADRSGGTGPAARRPSGLLLDLGRKRLHVDGEPAGLTYREYELLRFLVLREGRTVPRDEIVGALWSGDPATGSAHRDEAPNERTVDVHVRRLRAKLGGYAEVVRTVRGGGYRFDRHADVVIRYGEAQSPDRF